MTNNQKDIDRIVKVLKEWLVELPDKNSYGDKAIRDYSIPDIARSILNALGWEVVASGIVYLETEGFEGSLTGVWLGISKGRTILLNELLVEKQAIELEGKTIKIAICEE